MYSAGATWHTGNRLHAALPVNASTSLSPQAAAWRALSRVGYGPTAQLALDVHDLASAQAWALQQVDAAHTAARQPPALPPELTGFNAPLAGLADALAQLWRDFSRPDDVIVVASEFGRTCAENGSRGTDHGHGNAMWLIGSRVQGGRWHGAWDGLASGNLHEGRDLPVRNDYRAVLAQVLHATHAMAPAALDELFPGFAWDRSLDGMFRA